MDYIAWNNALVAHFFNDHRQQTPVYLLVTDGLLAKLYAASSTNTAASTDDEAVADFVRAVITGPAHMTEGQQSENICTRARKSLSCQDDWIEKHNNGLPLYVGYLGLFVLTWTRDLANVNVANFYDKLNALLDEHGYDSSTRGKISTLQLKETDELWSKLQTWANKTNGGRRGIFCAYCEGGHRYVGLSKAQALLNSRDIAHALPSIFKLCGFAPKYRTDRAEMAACIARYANQCGLSDRGWNLLNHSDPTLRKAVLYIALNELSSWDGTASNWERQPRVAASGHSRGKASWKIYHNGNERRLDLYCEHISGGNPIGSSVMCRSGSAHSHKKPVNADGTAFFTTHELVEAGFDLLAPLTVEVDHTEITELPPLATVVGGRLFFRWPIHARSGWLSPFDPRDQYHITASSIGVLYPVGVANLPAATLGETVLDSHRSSVVLSRRGKQYASLVRYTVPFTNDSQPFKLDSQECCVIGPQAYLEITDAADITYIADERVFVAVGVCATVVLRNTLLESTAFTADRGNVLADALTATLCIDETEYGNPITVTAAGQSIQVVFVPARPADSQPLGWQWRFEKDFHLVRRHYEKGERIGEFSGPGGVAIRCAFTAFDPLWWWEKDSDGNATAQGLPLCETVVARSEQDASLYRLHVWTQTPLKLLVNNEEVIDVPPHEPWAISLHELMLGRQNFDDGVGEEYVDVVSLNNATVAQIARIPSRPVLTVADGSPRVFVVGNTTNYSVIWIRESDLISGGVSSQSLSDLAITDEQLPRLERPESREREGVWLGLLAQRAAPKQLNEYLWLESPVEFMTVQRPAAGVSLADRIGATSASDVKRARAFLAALKALPAQAIKLRPLFEDAIAELCGVDCTPDRAFWETQFDRRCVSPLGPTTRPSALEALLGQMLQTGFNWLAEPTWLASSWERIRRAYKHQHRRFNQAQKQIVWHACPLIPAFPDLLSGYPWTDPQEGAAFRLSSYLGFLQGVGDGNRLKVRSPTVRGVGLGNQLLLGGGVPLRGFVDAGVVLRHPQFANGPRRVSVDGGKAFLQHEGALHRFHLAVDNEESLATYLTDDATLEDDFGEIYPSDLETLFHDGLNAAHPVIGRTEDRGLALMFSAVNQQLAATSRSTPSQRNRHAIYQAVLLSRLHDRHSKFGHTWPLRDPAAYRLVCNVMSQAWAVQPRRQRLYKDLIPIEWFLIWFSV
jgi:hypothetical protein